MSCTSAARMAQAQRRLQVAEVGQRAERPVELVVAQRRAELRVERDHLLPRRDAVQPVENLRAPGAEAVSQARIELRAPPFTHHSQRRLGAAGMVERLDAVGQVDQADGRSQAVGAGRPGHSPPVPPLEGLSQRIAHRRTQPQLIGKVASLLAVRLHHPLHRPARRGQELPGHPDPVETRLTAAEMTGDEDRQADTPQVPVARVGVELHLVAEQRCHLTGVDGTSHPRQQRGIVRGHAGGPIQPGRRPQAHGHHGLAQHPLHRPPHAQIRDQRQRRHQLGESHRTQGIRSHHPILPLMPAEQAIVASCG
jgi:hypothetical protein